MTIKQQGGIFGRNPTFNNVTVDGTLTVDQIVEKTGAAGITLDGVTLKDGNVVLADGKGIDFSATAGTGTSELFDDYEEGTWVPVVADAATGGNIGTGSRDGRYTKIGDMVFVQGWIVNANTTGLTAGNQLYVQGLPYAANSATIFRYVGSIITADVTFTQYLVPWIGAGATAFRISDVGVGNIPVSAATSGAADFYFTLAYKTS
jgi:hypothetical protein